uniref:Uncharacterized protein n=1 Tax=viral metagenome TaxID=1070528 RepID=A0A6H1ZPV5_9ZZZZ
MKKYRYEVSNIVEADNLEEAIKKIRKIFRLIGEGEHEDCVNIWEVE